MLRECISRTVIYCVILSFFECTYAFAEDSSMLFKNIYHSILNDGNNVISLQNQEVDTCISFDIFTLKTESSLISSEASTSFLNGSFESLKGSVGVDSLIGSDGSYGRVNGSLSLSTINIPEVRLSLKNGTYWNKSINGYSVGGNASYQLPEKFLSMKFDPFYSFTTLSAEEGSFYSFYGKIYVPYICAGGIQVNFLSQNLDCVYGLSRGHILANETDENLFDIDISFLYVGWNGGLELKDWKIGGKLAFLRSAVSAVGYLTMDNQQYAVFPYVYNWISAEGSVNVLITGINACVKFGSYNLLFGVDGFYVPESSFCLEQIYKMRNYPLLGFDGSYGTSEDTFEVLKGLCFLIPFISLSADYRIGQCNLNIEVKKEGLILLSNNFETEKLENEDFLSLRSLLLSGLSINFNISL